MKNYLIIYFTKKKINKEKKIENILNLKKTNI